MLICNHFCYFATEIVMCKYKDTNKVVLSWLMFRDFYLKILIACMMLAVPSASAAQKIYNNSGAVIGRIDADGTVYDVRSVRLGQFKSDGTIVNNSSWIVGKIERDGTVLGENGMKLGKIRKDGVVMDQRGFYLGKVAQDGTVSDMSSFVIGKAKDVPTAYTAILFFFKMLDIRPK